MAIGAIQSSPAFTGKIKTTEAGNEYKKTNAGKYICSGIGAIVGGITCAEAKDFYEKECKGNMENKIVKDIKKSFPKITKKVNSSQILKGIAVGIVALGVVSGFINGVIVDSFINQIRRIKADKAAQQA